VNGYNTYRRPGLPEGPIANPGKESIAAVLHPAQTKALYFVADGTGGHAFAESYEQHQKNVLRLRQLQSGPPAQPAAAAPPPPPAPAPAASHTARHKPHRRVQAPE